VLDNAQLKLVKTAGNISGKAPDHLLRLFTYNSLMQRIGSNYFTAGFISEDLIADAQKAYVVSPLSSLIVLETQRDYDRFNIHDSQNSSLHNASMHGSGSVPEPHEWFLIFLVATVAFYLYFGKRRAFKFRS
jgi:XrtN system VIT domain protein